MSRVVLVAESVRFRSDGDERAFFEWLGRIRAVGDLRGEGRTLLVPVRSKMDEISLRELLALFARYRIDMKQFAQFRTTTNERWFTNPRAFWFRKVFQPGRPAAKRSGKKSAKGPAPRARSADRGLRSRR